MGACRREANSATRDRELELSPVGSFISLWQGRQATLRPEPFVVGGTHP